MMLPAVAPGADPACVAVVLPWKTVDAGCMAALRRARREDAGTGAIGTADTRPPTKRWWPKCASYNGCWERSAKF